MCYIIEVNSNPPDGGRLQHGEKLIIGSIIIKKSEAITEPPSANVRGWKDCSADKVGLSRILLYDTKLQQKEYFTLNSTNTHTCYKLIRHM